MGGRRDRGRGGHARRAALDAAPAGGRVQVDRGAPRGSDRDRSRSDRHADPAQPRSRGQVRRVLRRGPSGALARRPRHDREHVSGVRGHLWVFPGRRRDAPLPAADRSKRRARGSGRVLLQGAAPLPRARIGADLLRERRARPLLGRAESGRPSPAPGSGSAHGGEELLSGGSRHFRPRLPAGKPRRGSGRVLSGERPARGDRRLGRTRPIRTTGLPRTLSPRQSSRGRRSRSSWMGRPSSSGTARWSSQRSRAAPTRRTPRPWSPRVSSRRTRSSAG